MTNKTKRNATLLNTSSLFVLGTASVLLGSGPAQAFDANSLQTGGNVTGGAATIATSGNTLTVNQASNRAIIDWRTFNIGANAQANFNQPGTSSIAVNRVNGSTDPSRIDGGLHANGQVWVLNPNGVFFGKTARVDAAGVVATTANINDKAFMAGSNKLQMTGGDNGQVVNEGHISVGEGGLAAFVAPSVRNSGTIRARVGKVTLAAGDTYTLDLAGDRLVEIGLGSNKAVVDQSGKIVNAGGVIDISAKAAGQVVDAVINTSGVTDASSVRTVGGKIILGADVINVASDASLKADGTSGGQITAVANKTGNYAGSYSAQGTTGDGGQIETSGKTVHIDNNIAVNTKSAAGKTGNWTLDPDDLTVQAGSGDTLSGSSNTDSQSSIDASTVVASLNTTDVTLQARKSITVNSAIDASGNASAHNLTLVDQDANNDLTVNLNAAITLKGAGVLSGQATVVNLTNGALIQNANDVAMANAAINLGTGSYAAGATLNKSGLTLEGFGGAVINVGAGQTGLTINANNITVEDLEIAGPLSDAYTNLDWTSQPNSWAIQVTSATTTGFNILANNIHDIRTGILLANSADPASGAAAGSINGNRFDNTKGAVIDQYRDGSGLTIMANRQGPTGNEWGVVYNTNLNISNTGNASNPSIYADTADSSRQDFLLGVAKLNNGLTVLDRGYTNANRTAVTVDAAATGTPDNGFGNARQPLSTIQAGVNAVVTGGTVNVKDGTYVIAPGGGNYVEIAKSLNLTGQSEAGTIIDARNASTYGIRVQADGVTLSNLTVNAPTAAGSYGIKVEPLANVLPIDPNNRLLNFNISNVTSHGSGKTELDLNGVTGATIDHFTANGASIATGLPTAGNGIALTDSADVTITNSKTMDNAWGGLALYQTNNTYNQQTNNITVDATNNFTEVNGIYAEDQSASKNFGTLNLAGYDYVVKSPTNPADVYTWLQKDEASAISYGAAVAPTTATVQGKSGNSVDGNNIFSVGSGLKIQSALNAAQSGATVNVQSGTYNEALSITTAGLTLHSVDPQGAIVDAGGADFGINIASNAGNLGTLTVDGFQVQGWTSVGINQSIAAGPFASMHVTNNIVYGPPGGATAHGNGIEVAGDGSVVSGNEVHLVHLNSPSWSGSGIIVANASDVTVDSNIVDGADTAIAVTSYGDTAAMTGITITNNHISNAIYEGISIQAYEGDYFGTASGPITGLTITGNTVSNSVSGLGIWDYSNGGAGGSAVWAGTLTNVSGNTFTGNTYQISTDFTGADVTPLLNGNTFDRSVVNALGGNTIYGDLQTAIDTELDHSTLNLAGTFGAGININKAGDILDGQGTAVIQALHDGDDGLTVSANNVTIKNLEIAGAADQSYLTYVWGSDITRGVVVKTGATGFNITGNNIHGTRNDILVDGRNNSGSITNNTIDNSKSGISVQYTDGTGIDISHNTEGLYGNEWGENLHLNGNAQGGSYHSGAASAGVQAALLADSAANGGWTVQDQAYASSNRTAVTVSATGNDANQGSPLNSLATIGAGVNAVVTGGTVNVKDGSYTLTGELDINKSLTLKGESEAGTVIGSTFNGYGIFVDADDVTLSNFTFNPNAAGSYGIKVQPNPADPAGAAARLNGFAIDHVTIAGSHKTGLDLNGVDGATIDHVTVTGTTAGNGIALTDSANVTLTNTTTSNNKWGGLALYQTNHVYDQQVDNISVDNTNSFNDTIPVYAEDQSSGTADPQSVVGGNGLNFGAITLAGFDYVVKSPNDANDVYSWFQKTQQDAINFATDAAFGNGNVNLPTATVQGYGGTGVDGDNHFTVGIGANGTAMSVNVALDQSATGGIIDVLNGTYAEDVAIITPRTVNFDGATLDSLSVLSGGAGSTLSGSVKAGSVTAFDINLGGDLSLDTSAAGGTIALANVDGTHDLTLNAGSGVVLAGGLGATTRLGAVDITADLIELGATNQAASFDFNGDVGLSAASTVIDTTVSSTAAGDITFAGDIFGTTDGGQSLTLTAGPGTGAKSANGDIAMNNAGISTVRLGNLTVSGDDFTALTVDLAGNFTSQLTGNQLFAADTLNAAGNVNSNVAGNIGGHIVSGGNVTLTAAGGVSGNITGKVVSLTGQTVNSQVTANTLNVNSVQGGTITGTFTPGTVSNGLVVNGTTVGSNTGTGNTGTGNTGTGNTGTGNTGTGNTGTGNTGGNGGNTANNFPNVNGQQLVVEGFALPAGTQIGANGQLILPPGTVIGLLSPGGGTPRVIMVQSVQELGALLDQGYSAIVIDLTGHKKATTKVASN